MWAARASSRLLLMACKYAAECWPGRSASLTQGQPSSRSSRCRLHQVNVIMYVCTPGSGWAGQKVRLKVALLNNIFLLNSSAKLASNTSCEHSVSSLTWTYSFPSTVVVGGSTQLNDDSSDRLESSQMTGPKTGQLTRFGTASERQGARSEARALTPSKGEVVNYACPFEEGENGNGSRAT